MTRGRPTLSDDRKRIRLSTTVGPETFGLISAAATTRSLALGEVIDDLVDRSPAYFRKARAEAVAARDAANEALHALRLRGIDTGPEWDAASARFRALEAALQALPP